MSANITLAQARAIYAILNDVEQKLDTVEKKMKTAKVTYADVYNAVQDIFRMLNKMGLPEDVAQGIAVIQRLITVAHSLYVAINALNAAMITTPAGALIAGIGFVAAALSTLSMVGSYG